MLPQQGNIKVVGTPKSGFPSNVVQVLQARPGPSGTTVYQARPSSVPVQSLITNQSIPINTNTAAQYARKPQEMTIVTPSGTYMASPLQGQQFGQVVNIGQGNVGLAQTLIGAPGVGIAPQSGPGTPQTGNSLASSRKPCNCTKSHCLKLYCECFAQGQLCQNCNCNHCMNNLAYEEERGRAIKMTLERNPTAFHPKIGRGEGERKHTKGCNCKRSGCLKNYCECYEAKISCSDLCRCLGCRNTEDSIERRSLMRLAAMGSLRSRQPNAFRKHLVKPPSETMPHAFISWETIEATACCLLAQAEDAERRDLPQASQERLIIEEFSRTLDRIVEATSKAQIRSSTSLVPTGSGLSDDMVGGIGSRGGNTGIGGGSSIHRSSHRHHGNDDDDLVGEDDEDDFQDVSEQPRGGGGSGDGGTGGFEEEEGDEDDMDLLDRHHYQRRSHPGGESSGSGKIPSVKFISRPSGGGRSSYYSRKDLL
ncbi:unnamed protein product [Hymenolepis diminuta]|uniref:CRC domain-containing protein n=1 Tax=Hymenolepis diminuta TaxID=6216 RepID=A0A0R3SV89_HYMDI|nr:unnamed protein product [Hymenolepis diminuta]VUZ49034.1 unnamed protein product [Hymenolepis diminuta]